MTTDSNSLQKYPNPPFLERNVAILKAAYAEGNERLMEFCIGYKKARLNSKACPKVLHFRQQKVEYLRLCREESSRLGIQYS